MSGSPEDPHPSKDEVLRHLARATPSGTSASAQFFLDVPEDEVGAAAQRLFDAARAAAPGAVEARLGKVHRLARSFSARGDPAFLAELAKATEIKGVLPNEANDILPQPRNVRRLDPE